MRPREDHFGRWSCRLVVVEDTLYGHARVLRRTPLSGELGVGRRASSSTLRQAHERFSSVQPQFQVIQILTNGHWVEVSGIQPALALNPSLRPVKTVSKRHGLGNIASNTYRGSANVVVLLFSSPPLFNLFRC
jgi:hypothetical protein